MRRSAVRACLLASGLMVLSAPATAWAADTAPADPPTSVDPSAPVAPTDPTTPEPPTTEATPEPAAVEVAPSEAPIPEAPVPEAPAEDVVGEDVTAPVKTNRPGAQISRPAAEQQVTITITSPTDGAQVPPGQPVEVTGTVTIGLLGSGVSIVYIVDTSGSTSSFAGDCNGDGVEDLGDDLNNDGSEGEVIDCEIAGVKTLEDQLAGINGAIETGLVDFDSGFDIVTGFGAPGRAELDDAVSALDSGGGTDFDSALEGMNDLFADATAGNRKIGYLFTDGEASVTEGPGSELQAAIDAGIVVNTFSVGPGSVGCGADSPLTVIANATGGQCIQVDDPADLISVLEGLRPAGIEKVEVSVNGGPPVLADVDLLGNFKVTVTGIVVGANKIVATVTTTEGQTASDEVTVTGGVEPDTGAETTDPRPLRVAAAVASSPRFTG